VNAAKNREHIIMTIIQMELPHQPIHVFPSGPSLWVESQKQAPVVGLQCWLHPWLIHFWLTGNMEY